VMLFHWRCMYGVSLELYAWYSTYDISLELCDVPLLCSVTVMKTMRENTLLPLSLVLMLSASSLTHSKQSLTTVTLQDCQQASQLMMRSQLQIWKIG